VSREEGGWDTAVRAVAAFLAATATALTVLFVPLAIGWVVVRRTRSAVIVAATLMAGLAVQGVVILAAGDTAQASTGSAVHEVRDELAVHVFAVFLLGTRWIPSLWKANWQALVVVPTLLVIAIFAVLFPGAGRRAQALAGVLVAYALAVFLFTDIGRGSHGMGLREFTAHSGGSPRYSVLPVFFLASAAAVLVDPHGEGGRRRVAKVAAPLLIAQIVLVAVISFPATTIGSDGPDWRTSMAETYAHACHGVPSSQLVLVATNRLGKFRMTLPCRDLQP
jgi:hypothetical protein